MTYEFNENIVTTEQAPEQILHSEMIAEYKELALYVAPKEDAYMTTLHLVSLVVGITALKATEYVQPALANMLDGSIDFLKDLENYVCIGVSIGFGLSFPILYINSMSLHDRFGGM